MADDGAVRDWGLGYRGLGMYVFVEAICSQYSNPFSQISPFLAFELSHRISTIIMSDGAVAK
ncbi:MAG: hypothetical protein PHZ00_01280 [Candidatus Peribacteraceae bacterium]|nr:hypothetical protein [Candidatus Peribacteraceae bacterium]